MAGQNFVRVADWSQIITEFKKNTKAIWFLQLEFFKNYFLPVGGHIPPLAKEAAMTDNDSQVTSIEQHWKYKSVVVVKLDL